MQHKLLPNYDIADRKSKISNFFIDLKQNNKQINYSENFKTIFTFYLMLKHLKYCVYFVKLL